MKIYNQKGEMSMILDYTVKLSLKDGPMQITGRTELAPGANHLALPLPEGKLRSVKATLRRPCAEHERIFMNGFQTWTYCPEYRRGDRIRGLSHLPRAAVRHYGLDRYGDNYFVPYPNRAGHFHGESWCYFRLGERFTLLASLDEEPGYTLFSYDARRGVLTLERDCEGLGCGGGFHAFDLYLAEGAEDAVFDGWFDALGVRPRTAEKLTGYSSWYNRYQDISSQSIADDLRGCAQVLRPGDLFQIDDGWEPFVGDWLETDRKKFPDGLRPLVEEIHARGFQAGLWLAPFVAQKGSALYQEHPDWFYRVDGKPWYCGVNWGGFYALDIDNAAVVDYLERVFCRVFDEWGFDLVKLDFLYGAAPFGNERESRAGRMRRAMELLRELCGDKLILGCGVPLMPAFGLADYCRVSCDVGLDWDGSWLMRQTHRERVSTRQAIGNSIFRRQLNGRAWLSDPDVFFLREDNLKLTQEQKEKLATVNALFGGMLLCSDDMSAYTGAARAFYEKLLRIRDAQDVRVENDDALRVSYTLDGERYTLTIPE